MLFVVVVVVVVVVGVAVAVAVAVVVAVCCCCYRSGGRLGGTSCRLGVPRSALWGAWGFLAGRWVVPGGCWGVAWEVSGSVGGP